MANFVPRSTAGSISRSTTSWRWRGCSNPNPGRAAGAGPRNLPIASRLRTVTGSPSWRPLSLNRKSPPWRRLFCELVRRGRHPRRAGPVFRWDPPLRATAQAKRFIFRRRGRSPVPNLRRTRRQEPPRSFPRRSSQSPRRRPALPGRRRHSGRPYSNPCSTDRGRSIPRALAGAGLRAPGLSTMRPPSRCRRARRRRQPVRASLRRLRSPSRRVLDVLRTDPACALLPRTFSPALSMGARRDKWRPRPPLPTGRHLRPRCRRPRRRGFAWSSESFYEGAFSPQGRMAYRRPPKSIFSRFPFRSTRREWGGWNSGSIAWTASGSRPRRGLPSRSRMEPPECLN